MKLNLTCKMAYFYYDVFFSIVPSYCPHPVYSRENDWFLCYFDLGLLPFQLKENLSNNNNLFNFKNSLFSVPLGVLSRWFFHYQNWYWWRTHWSWYQNCSSLERRPNWVRRGEKDQRGCQETFPIHWISHQTSCWEGARQRSFWRRGRRWQNGGNY